MTWADITPTTVSFLWEPYIPLGKVTLLEGREDIGKSWLCCAIATGVTLGKGLPWQDETEPRSVLFLSTEDGLADTLVPRITPMGADLTRIHSFDTAFQFDHEGFQILGKYIRDNKISLAIFDPLFAFFGGRVNINQSNQTREVMSRLARMAERLNVAIFGLRHLAKASGSGLGSVDIGASARSILFAGIDPSDTTNRAVIHAKSNLSAKGKTIGYTLNDGFKWTGESTLTKEIILGDPKVAANLIEVKQWLEGELVQGPRSRSELVTLARKAGFSPDEVRKAGQSLGVDHFQSTMSGAWTYKLPEKKQAQIAAEEW